MTKLGILALLMVCVAELTFAIGLARDSLWVVVQTCAANYDLTGAPFPCLSVASSSGNRDGYVVLRSPVGVDTIWSPTRRVIGLEDPVLRGGGDAAGYFLDAWNSRDLVPGFGDGRAARVIVLAINSAMTRSQDQLHIHMGCAAPSVEKWAVEAVPKSSDDRWAKIDAPAGGRQIWVRRVARDDLEKFNPFDLAAELASANAMNLSQVLIVVVGIRSIDSRPHFLLAAGTSSQFGNRDDFDAKQLMSRACRS